MSLTTEQQHQAWLSKRTRPLTEGEAQRSLQRFIDEHFNNRHKEQPRTCIPCHPDDDDVFLGDYLSVVSAELAEWKARAEDAERRLEGIKAEMIANGYEPVPGNEKWIQGTGCKWGMLGTVPDVPVLSALLKGGDVT